MSVLSVVSFLTTAIFLTLMPGPDNLFVLAQSIAKGKKAGIVTALGLCSGLLVHITAAAIGISAIIYQSSVAFAIIKYAGALYLLYLAYKSFRDTGSNFSMEKRDSLSYKALYKKGIIMNVLNPKVSLFFLALFPQFIDYATGRVPLQMVMYGFIFLLQAFVLFMLISVFAGAIGEFLCKSSSLSQKMNLIQGAIFTLIGIKIAFSHK